MTEISVDLIRSEVIDWWDDERARVVAECRVTANKIQKRLEDEMQTLGKVDLISPRSEAYSVVKNRALADLEMLSRRLKCSIEESAAHSIDLSERRLDDEGISLMDSLPFVASGAAAAGSLGLAAAAASFATTKGTFLVLIPVTTISWPLFAALGAGALTLSYFSPQLLNRSLDGLRAKYVKSLKAQIENAVFGASPDPKTNAICPQYLGQLDAICQQRLDNLI